YHFACVHHRQLHLEQLKLEASHSSSATDNTSVHLPTEAIATPRTPETHAYRISHVDVTDTQARRSVVAADIAFVRNDTPTATENKLISAIDGKRDDTNFSPYSSRHSAGDSTEISSDAKSRVRSDDQRQVTNRQYANDERNEAVSVWTSSSIEHFYEEIRTINEPRSILHDIHDYYEKYSPTTAKTLIDTLFLPQHKICQECARTSPVYTDRLIYTRQPLHAIEVVLCQRDDVSCFRYLREGSDDALHSQYNQNRDCMLIYSYAKTNAAGIFYSHRPRDVFDLKSLLKPSIRVISHACRNAVVNTQLYHRRVNNYYVRISRTGCASMTFYCNRGTMINCTKRMSCYNDDSQDSLIHRTYRSNDDSIEESRRNRSSLLLLEPLLLIPELTSGRSGRRKNSKNRVFRSKRTKIIRILIAYVLSFFILAGITFYIVYFT
ncbi:uncharacterized protein, partial [Linepithema humile]|uniref:uncharacterized protein n=1 Tax=Linepithema humile TaxID=83485 RepID=UPI00351DAC2D